MFVGVAVLSAAGLSLLAQTEQSRRAPDDPSDASPGARRRSRQPRGDAGAPQTGRPIRVLFLGQDEEQPHNPAKMFPLLAAPLARRGIQLTYAATPAEALDAGKARVLRRADDLRQPHRDHARAGEGAARLRRGRPRR